MKVKLKKTVKSYYPFLIAGLILLISFPAAASKPKLMVLPITGNEKISHDDANYLLDSMFEAASLRIAGEIILITKQGTKKAVKSVSKNCKEDCAISAAKKTGAGIALICDLNSYEDKTVGFVKLLDTADQAVLSAKRFIVKGNDLRAIEAGMQSAVRYVLSAKFLPLSQAQQTSLARTQGNMPPARYSEQVEGPIMVNIPQEKSASTPVVSGQNNDEGYMEPEPEPEPYVEPLTPEEASGKKRVYLITAIVLDSIGAGLSFAGLGFFVKAKKELKNKDSWIDAQVNDYNTIIADPATSDTVRDYYTQKWYEAQDNIDTIDQTVKSNNIAGSVLLGVGGASLLTSIIFWVKFSKMKKLAEPGMISFNPVVSPTFNGAFLTGSF